MGTIPDGMAEHAGSALRASLREPAPPFNAGWVACTYRGREAMDFNALLPLVAAWRRIDPEQAAELVRTALDACGADGSLPRYAAPGLSTPGRPHAWPLLARAARRGNAAASDDNPEDFLDRLRTYLGWAVQTFDPDGSGRPLWPGPEDAFIPDTWDADLFTVDLASFLRAEFEAFDAIQARAGIDMDDDPRVPRNYREALADHLQTFLWDPRSRRFSDRYRSGKRIARATLSSLAPLLWSGLPASLYDAARRPLQPGSPLLTPNGLSLWEAWPDDPEVPPTPFLQQAVIYDALRAPGLERERREMDRRLAPALARALGCPRDAGQGTAAGPGDPSAGNPVEAALAVSLTPAAEDAHAGDEATWVSWLDRHTRGILRGLAAAILLFVAVLLVLPRFFPLSGEGASIEALAGLAQNHYAGGRFEEAERLYVEILTRNRFPAAAFRLGNVLYRQGRFAEAEELYREAMQHADLQVQARFNLAQSLLRQGRNEEAMPILEHIVSENRREYPEVASLATTALRLLRQASDPSPDG